MLFAARLISQQPPSIQFDEWQEIVAEQLQATKTLRDEGKIRACGERTENVRKKGEACYEGWMEETFCDGEVFCGEEKRGL